ncbi:electron transfer flavoprotein subunit alpha, mitochondrial [Hordeum vulgare]|nr:electron transfer flavoprotein subunit alpha, mitochondrial [Hordeum vulgare]
MAAPASPGEDMDMEVAAFLASCAAFAYGAAEALLDRLDAPASLQPHDASSEPCAAASRILPSDRTASAAPSTSASSPTTRAYNNKVRTLIIAEHEGGLVKPSSLGALAVAEAIAKENKVSLLLGGSGPMLHKAAQHAASSHPLVNEVLVADSDVFAHPLAKPWAELLRSVQQKGGYSHVIASSTSFGKNLLPRATTLLDVSAVTDVAAISEPRVFVRPIYAGNALYNVRYTVESPCMMIIRSTSFSPATKSMSETKVAPITQVDLSFLREASSRKPSWVNLTSQDTERPDLANARVVVTGGRGLKSTENFKLLAQLAEKLGAAVGATRAAVDAGYVPNELQDMACEYQQMLELLRKAPFFGRWRAKPGSVDSFTVPR